MATHLTRRNVTALLCAVPVAAQVISTTPPAGAPQPPKPPATPEERMQKAYADVRGVSNRLRGIELPMNVEPAFTFQV